VFILIGVAFLLDLTDESSRDDKIALYCFISPDTTFSNAEADARYTVIRLLSKRASALALEKTRTWSRGNNKALLWFITILCDCIQR
jgi:hypothetical protein